jgi:hypothetical protein
MVVIVFLDLDPRKKIDSHGRDRRPQPRRRPPAGLILEIKIAERLARRILHDEASAIVFLDRPGRWEAARWHAGNEARQQRTVNA